MHASTPLNAGEGFGFAPSATLEEFSSASAQWPAPNKRLGRAGLRRELNQAIDSLRECVRLIEGFTDEQRSLSEAAQWLVDNFYLIERTRTQLSLQLAEPELRGLPAYQNGLRGKRRARVELLAQFYLQACDFDFEADELVQVLVDYQRTHPLTLQELALLAPVLNFLLIRQLRVSASQIIEVHRAGHWADQVADTLLKRSDAAGPGRREEPDLAAESPSCRQAYLGSSPSATGTTTPMASPRVCRNRQARRRSRTLPRSNRTCWPARCSTCACATFSAASRPSSSATGSICSRRRRSSTAR